MEIPKQSKGRGWHKDSRRHSLARKRIKTVLPDGRRLRVDKYVAEGRKEVIILDENQLQKKRGNKMAGKGRGWHGDSRRHSLARRKVSSRPNHQISVDERSGLWFESHGIIGDMVSLVQLIDFDSLDKKQARGIEKEQYNRDATEIMIFPSEKTKDSIEWLIKEYSDGSKKRKNQVKKMLSVSIKEVEKKLKTTKNIDVRIDLQKSRMMLRDLEKELK